MKLSPLAHFPDERPDEPLYSILARHHQLTGHSAYSQTLYKAFGTSRPPLIADELPSRLGALLARMPNHDLTYEDMLQTVTSVPYYSRFWDQGTYHWIIQQMHGFGDANLRLRAGMRGPNIKHHLCVCLQCIEEDRKKYGDAYWHRAHQLPGVLVCPHHPEVIIHSTTVLRQPRRFQIVPLSLIPKEDFTPIIEHHPRLMKHLRQIAQDSYWLLQCPRFLGGKQYLQDKYTAWLGEHNLLRRAGRFRRAEMMDIIERNVPNELLILLQLKPESHDRWCFSTLKSLENYHPLRHIITILSLGSSCQQMFKEVDRSFHASQFKCQNPVCPDYHHFVDEIFVNKSKHSNKSGNQSFYIMCPTCSFTYRRKKTEKNPNYSLLVRPGRLWETRLMELASTDLGRRPMARLLGVQDSTLTRHASRLGIKKWTFIPKMIKRPPVNIEELQIKFLQLKKLHPDAGRTELGNLDLSLTGYLKRHAPGWLADNQPPIRHNRSGNSPKGGRAFVDWETYDSELEQKILNLGQELIEEYIKHPPTQRVGMEHIIVKLEHKEGNMVRRNSHTVPKSVKALHSFRDMNTIVKKKRIQEAHRKLITLGMNADLKTIFRMLHIQLNSAYNKSLFEELSVDFK